MRRLSLVGFSHKKSAGLTDPRLFTKAGAYWAQASGMRVVLVFGSRIVRQGTPLK